MFVSKFLGVATAMACAGAALGQGSTNQVQLQLRLVSQIGTPSNPSSPVTSADVDIHTDTVSGLGVPRRFEVQYRLVDLDSTDAFVPAGLASSNVRIVASGGTLERAILSRFEARAPTGGVLPPVTMSVNLDPDNFIISGNVTIGAYRGLQFPFRGGIPAPSPNNDHPANGVFSAGNSVLSGITPLSLTQSDQNDGGWYGLFSFNFIPTAGSGSVTVLIDADSMTGNRFGFFSAGDPVVVNSPNATSDTATVLVGVSPSGGCCIVSGGCITSQLGSCQAAGGVYLGDSSTCSGVQCPGAGACCTAANACAVRFQSACVADGGFYRGDQSTCSPNLCPPPFACCLPGFVCLIASTSSDCVTAGGSVLPQSSCQPQICCPSPVISVQPMAMLFTPPQSVSFSVIASHPGTLTYQWRRGVTALTNSPRITGATSPTLTILNTEETDVGNYTVVVTSSCGVSVTSVAAALTRCESPTISQQPSSETVNAGSSVTLTIEGSGIGTVLLQWRKNGVPLAISPRIASVTSSALTITDVQPGDDGLYDCIVTTPCGAVQSQLAAVVVSCAGAGAARDCNANQLCDVLELAGLRDVTAPAPATGDRFGWSVALDGQRLLVGARGTDLNMPSRSDAGAAYMYQVHDGVYVLEVVLAPDDLAADDDFGNLVVLEGEWAVVAARHQAVAGQAEAGAVYVYRLVSGAWTLFQKLTEPAPSGPGAGNWFGHGLNLDGDRLVIGSPRSQGAAARTGVSYVYRFNGLNWARETTLAAADGASNDGFGISVAIDDPYLIVGAPYRRTGAMLSNSGAAYVYFRSSSGWVLQTAAVPSNPEADQTFGELVDISDDIAVVNAPRETVAGFNDAGAIYALRRTDTRWTQQRRLTSPSPQAGELYGFYIALEADTLAAGAFARTIDGNVGAGSVDLFKRRGNFWSRAGAIASPKPEPSGFFGYSLAIDGGKMAAGAFGGSARLTPQAGWVRTFDLGVLDCDGDSAPDVCEIASGSESDADGNGIPDACQELDCLADFNSNGALSVQDILDFLVEFFEANLTADFNDNGTLTVQDIFDFLAAYFAGCA